MEGEEEKFGLSLMECTICNEIVHPGCLKVMVLGTLEAGMWQVVREQGDGHSCLQGRWPPTSTPCPLPTDGEG